MITIQKMPDMGQPTDCEWGYRVHLSKEEDWSGSAPTEDEAWKRAKVLRDAIASASRTPAQAPVDGRD